MSRFARQRPGNREEVSHNLASRESWEIEDQCTYCQRITFFNRDICTECRQSKKQKSHLPNPILPFED